MSQWKVGDVVRLKSGSPKMTVTGPPDGPNGYQQVCFFEKREVTFLSLPECSLCEALDPSKLEGHDR